MHMLWPICFCNAAHLHWGGGWGSKKRGLHVSSFTLIPAFAAKRAKLSTFEFTLQFLFFGGLRF